MATLITLTFPFQILRPSGKLRSLTHLAVVDGFEGNPANLRGLRIGIDASIWFFHAAHGREGENPELRTLFFRCARLLNAPFLPLFIFDGPKRPKVKRGKRISGEKHWLVDSMKKIIEVFGFEWRMAPGEAEAELAHLNSIGVIDAILSDDVDNFLFGAKMVIRNPSVNLTGNNKHATKNADGRVDGNHSTIYTSIDILAHPSVQLTRGGLILIGLLSGGDYHPAGVSRCGPGIAHGLAKCGLGDELLEASQSLTRAELADFLTTWRESLRNELRTNSRGHLGSKKPSLAKAVPDSFPDIDVLLSYTNPITSATDVGARRTHTPPQWEREPDLAKIAHMCELHFEWGLKDIIIKRFRTVLWPSIVLRALRRSALVAVTETVAEPPSTPVKEKESHQDVMGTPSKLLARHFSSMGLGGDGMEDGDDGLGDLIVKIHGSRTHAYTDGILEYRLEIAPAQLVRLASAGVQGLRKPADTTYDVQPSESEDSDDLDGEGGTNRKKRRGGPPPEPDSHLRVWMPACMVRIARPDLVNQYEAALEAKRAKKSSKGTRARAKAKSTLPSSKRASQAAPVPTGAECCDLDVSSSEDSEGRASPLPLGIHSRPPHMPLSQDTLWPSVPAQRDVSADLVSTLTQGNTQHILDVISDGDVDDDALAPSEKLVHLSSPSKVLQKLDLNLNAGFRVPRARPPTALHASPAGNSGTLRPFPIAFEEEPSGNDRDPSRPSTSRGHGHSQPAPSTPTRTRTLPAQPRPLLIPHEEEEESSDDPDATVAELPVLTEAQRLPGHFPTRGRQEQQLPYPMSMPATDVPVDNESPTAGRCGSCSPTLRRSPPRQRHARQQCPSSPLKARRYAQQQQQQQPPARRSPSPDDERPVRPWVRAPASPSVISVSSDSDISESDGGSLALAPLLIARSRTGLPQLTPFGEDLGQEVIDLT
ncbi:hypothetical protein BJV78DRAFT_1279225 [Lactifluus subvellereus]|nr:hypothetical protein BJV78DRAFT_1279225 [Lactifluus subvellereus]